MQRVGKASEKGITLVEIMVSLAIGMIVLSLGFSMLITVVRYYSSLRTSHAIKTELRYIEQFVREEFSVAEAVCVYGLTATGRPLDLGHDGKLQDSSAPIYIWEIHYNPYGIDAAQSQSITKTLTVDTNRVTQRNPYQVKYQRQVLSDGITSLELIHINGRTYFEIAIEDDSGRLHKRRWEVNLEDKEVRHTPWVGKSS